MATRSSISLQRENGEIVSVYCHWDGYPDYNGALLLEHYNTPEKIEELLALGDMSSLSENIAPQEGEKHSFDSPAAGVCVFYHRDREEPWDRVKPMIHSKFEDVVNYYDGCEYNYLFKDGKWYYGGWKDKQPKELNQKACGLEESPMDIDSLVEEIRKLDWTAEYDGSSLELQTYSPAGQHFVRYIDGSDVDELIRNIYVVHEDFDVSYETYLWLDSLGHGCNGAPYDMKELYEDMEWCKNALLELYEELV